MLAGFTTCAILVFQKLNYPRGKGLGGSTNNYLAYIRGSRHDYDQWAQLGCDGWSYRDILPYMMKCEGNSNEEYLKSGEFLSLNNAVCNLPADC